MYIHIRTLANCDAASACIYIPIAYTVTRRYTHIYAYAYAYAHAYVC